MCCTVLTEYDSQNLKTYLSSLLPGWHTFFPATEASITHLPSQRGSSRSKKVQELATFLGVTAQVADDRLDGHCETCAVLMASTVEKVLLANQNCTADVLGRCLIALRNDLTKASLKVQMETIFAAERKVLLSVQQKDVKDDDDAATLHKENRANERTRIFWPATSEISLVLPRTRSWCAGGSETQNSFASAVDFVCEKGTVVRLPLYLLCYIFDGDELTKADLEYTEIETAQYSVHVLALVLDGRTKTCYACDPNGHFKPGSGLEYLHLPLQERSDVATTFLSKHDIERQRNTATKRRKKCTPKQVYSYYFFFSKFTSFVFRKRKK